MTEQPLQLYNTDPDDIENLIEELQISFNVKLNHADFNKLNTLDDLCDLFQKKAVGIDAHDCTSQQAFYKLRDAITQTVLTDKNAVTPDTDLLLVFPRAIRRKKVAEIEKILGFKTNLLRSRYWVKQLISSIAFASFVLIFFAWQIAVAGITISILLSLVSSKLANEMDLQTVREFTEKLVLENYSQVRRNNQTINRAEIPPHIREFFCHRLGLTKHALAGNQNLWVPPSA